MREHVLHRLLQARLAINGPAGSAMRHGLRLGSHLGVASPLKLLAHPQWLVDSAAAIPSRPISFASPAPATASTTRLCERIVRAYALARDHRADLSPIWVQKIGTNYRTLAASLEAGDPAAVNEQLRWMFRRPFLAGISTPIDYEDPLAARYWALMTYDRLVSLAEAIGATTAECPEQGISGRVLFAGIDALPDAIEATLGISLDYPRVGAPYGIVIGGRLITREIGQHPYAAALLRMAIEAHLRRPPEDVDVVEIGAGFGGAAMWFTRMCHHWSGSYTIVDLPLMNAFQAYFLGGVLGAEAIGLYGEEVRGAKVRILPTHALHEEAPSAVDVVFNQDSLPEMSEASALGYLTWMQEHLSGVFVSSNQEAATPVQGVAQLVVGQLTDRLGGFSRVLRQPSWTRRGYVDEVYLCGARR